MTTERLKMNRPQNGFTLIELLIVVGVLGILVVAFGPSIANAISGGDKAATVARMLELKTMLETYERNYGAYPPDDYSTLGSRQKEWQLGSDNGKNTGVESMVMHLMWENRGGGKLDEHEDWLQNTDGDKAPTTIPMLSRNAKVEVVDAWGTPIAYFSAKHGSGYQGSQRIVAMFDDGETIELVARPWKNPNSDAYLGPRTFQLISAGEDGKFNTDDDLVVPERPVPN